MFLLEIDVGCVGACLVAVCVCVLVSESTWKNGIWGVVGGLVECDLFSL